MTTDGSKRCLRCEQVKPLTDFHRDSSRKDGHGTRCKTCDNSRAKPQNTGRIVRTRARQRAAQLLIDAHQDEFHMLYEQCLTDATEQAARLAATTSGNDAAQREPVRLRPGRRRDGETERINEDYPHV